MKKITLFVCAVFVGLTFYANENSIGIKTDVVITSLATDAPFGSSPQSFCNDSNATLIDIIINGQLIQPANIKWYAAATGGSELPKTTVLQNGVTYHASQTVGGEESVGRLAVTIILSLPDDAFFEFAQTSFCDSDQGFYEMLDANGDIIFTDDAINTFSITAGTAGSFLDFDEDFGELYPEFSDVGEYTITRFLENDDGCVSQHATVISITSSQRPPETISYDKTAYCKDGADPILTLTGVLDDIKDQMFTVNPPTGLAINLSTGAIDLSNSIASDINGNAARYIISYVGVNACGVAASGVSTIINVGESSAAIFGFQGIDIGQPISFCSNDSNPVTTTTDSGGTFTSPNGLQFMSDGRTVDISGTGTGTYTMVHTVNKSGCIAVESLDITINLSEQITELSYDQTVYCEGDANPTPILVAPVGVFSSAPAGLQFANASKGTIDVAATTPGLYTVTYTTNGVCNTSQSVQVRVKLPTPDPFPEQYFCSPNGPFLGLLDIGSYVNSDTALNPVWYVNATGPLEYEPGLLQTGTYYLAYQVDTCETPRVPVEVIVVDDTQNLELEVNIDGAGFKGMANQVDVPLGSSVAVRLVDDFGGDLVWSSNASGPLGTTEELLITNSATLADGGDYSVVLTNIIGCPNTTLQSASLSFLLNIETSTTVQISPKVYLQGAMLNSPDGLMRDDLRTLGYLPTTSPYTDAVTVPATTFNDATNAANDIVDWVWVELRDAADNTSVMVGQSALIQRDGDVVNSASNALEFAAPTADYYVVIKHRNHLGIMSKDPISLSSTPTIVNFTTGSGTETFGTEAQTIVGMPFGTFGMWAGDANGDGKLIYRNSGSDFFVIQQLILNDPLNIFNSVLYTPLGYFNEDLFMDGNAIFRGSGFDMFTVFNNVFNHSNNSFNSILYTIEEQLP